MKRKNATGVKISQDIGLDQISIGWDMAPPNQSGFGRLAKIVARFQYAYTARCFY